MAQLQFPAATYLKISSGDVLGKKRNYFPFSTSGEIFHFGKNIFTFSTTSSALRSTTRVVISFTPVHVCHTRLHQPLPLQTGLSKK